MRLKTLLVFPLVIIIVFGGIALADGLGLWQTESSKVPILIKEGDFEGSYDPGDIRGSYSFADIENAFDVPSAVIAQAFGIESETPGDILAKDLEEIYGETKDGLEVGTGAIRTFIAYYIGMEYISDDGIPIDAMEVLKAEGKWSDELDILFEGKLIDLSQFDTYSLVSDGESKDVLETEMEVEDHEEAVAEDHDEDEQLVKGKTTVKEIISWGISLEIIEEILNVKVENDNMLVRDICENNGLSFNDVKTAINNLLEP